VFGNLVGLLLLELRRDVSLGPALVGAFLSFLLALFLARGVQLRRVLFLLIGLLLVRLAPFVGFLLVLLARLVGLALLDALLLLFLALAGLPLGVLLLLRLRRFLFQPVGAGKEARSLAVCLLPSAMVRPRGQLPSCLL
jgi:hypothetical protein